MQGVDDREPEAGQRNDDDEENGDARGGARDGADLFPGDLRERAPAATGRRPEDDEVVHGAREADAGDEPDEARRPAELRGEDRADQRSGPRNGGEMVTKEHEAMGR